MEFALADWLDLLLRWMHVIAGIAWIGSSFFFNWLDSRLAPPERARPGVEGELWLVHSGGFYQVAKIDVAPEELPRELHWFKWEAAATWITGMALLGLVFYLEAGIYLVDPAVADVAPGLAIAIGIGALALAWLVYDRLWISPLALRPGIAALVSLALAVALAYGLSQALSGRGAYMHVGAMLGTLMAANVWARIIPAQQELVAARRHGRAPDAALAAKAKQRSLHNNYMTLPVVLIMISAHYPSTYGHRYGWLILVLLSLVGAAVRHFFNLRNKGRARPSLLGAAAVGMLAVVVLAATRPDADASRAIGPGEAAVAFAEARAVIAERCATCHSARPTDDSVDKAPGGVAFDTPAEIRRYAQKINARAVLTQTMPIANKTQMTPEERQLLARWLAQGARID